jgi:hypothetical protein
MLFSQVSDVLYVVFLLLSCGNVEMLNRGQVSKNDKWCSQCKYYVKPGGKTIVDEFFGKCSKFIEMDTNAGELKYKYAAYARIMTYDCGIEGKYFQPLGTHDNNSTTHTR